MNALTPEQRAAVLAVAGKYGVTGVRLFGSRARGDAEKTSDYDFLYRAPEAFSFIDLYNMEQELAALLHAPVDLVEESAVTNPYLRKAIFAEMLPL